MEGKVVTPQHSGKRGLLAGVSRRGVERHKEIQNFQRRGKVVTEKASARFVTSSRQEFYKPKVSVNLDGWPLEFDWLQDQTFDAGTTNGGRSGQRLETVTEKSVKVA